MANRAGLDRASVVEAAAKLVDEEGIDQLSLSRLAERLGVRTPSLYNHITGLAGLKSELALYCLRDLYEMSTRAAVGKSHEEAIIAFANAYLAYAREAPGRYAMTLAPDPEDEKVQALAREMVQVTSAILAPYHLSEEDTIHALRSLRSIVHGFISIDAVGGYRMPVDRSDSFQWMLRLYIDGLNKLRKDA